MSGPPIGSRWTDGRRVAVVLATNENGVTYEYEPTGEGPRRAKETTLDRWHRKFKPIGFGDRLTWTSVEQVEITKRRKR